MTIRLVTTDYADIAAAVTDFVKPNLLNFFILYKSLIRESRGLLMYTNFMTLIMSVYLHT